MGEDAPYYANYAVVTSSKLSLAPYIRSYVLTEIEKFLTNAGHCLSHFHLPQPSIDITSSFGNRLIMDELAYDVETILADASEQLSRLNLNQKSIYDAILNSVNIIVGKTFFIYGYGGTGKTFLWNTLLNNIRAQGKIALAVTSSGIAALLLPGDRTSHSRFKIPLDIHEHSVCSIKKNTHLSELIQQSSLIIWDEAPVNHKHCFEALDRTLRDIQASNDPTLGKKQFRGITVVLEGDFRQMLPAIPNARKNEILSSSITRSYLWHQCNVMYLTENMRLQSPTLSDVEREHLQAFAKWLLSVSDGTVADSSPTDQSDTTWIKIPEYLLLPPESRSLMGLISYVYNALDILDPTSYFCERAILAPTNEIAASINSQMILHLATVEMSYYSSDSIDDNTSNHAALEALYPIEFLNTVQIAGLPEHHLQLKIGVPIMLLRNLNPSKGLCNGTRLIVTQLTHHIIEGEIITGKAKGSKAYISRIVCTSVDKKLPFRIKRRQFPVRVSYVMTINKSQGQTLRRVGVYIPSPVFTHGQPYVAFSRMT
ncbi:uncharacterized protein LOC133914674 [Phragmites australis]|uniref:uncharacterized protein LOC133914674 n=1 Tax=Phragmites australis TaxID=29695 RepID=UPI002D7811B3|nr:uncharacterized protein LOC133914674 [Phragmites australis]